MGDNNGFSENTCPEDLAEDCSQPAPPAVYLRRIEIVYENIHSSEASWPRNFFPCTRDGLALQAVVWATEDSGDRQGSPYTFWRGCGDGDTLPNDSQLLCSMGRGPVGNERLNTRDALRRARPDLFDRRSFLTPSLDVWRSHLLPASFPVAAWPSAWPFPTFAWHELAYSTRTSGARDPRPYYYENSSALETAPGSNGWFVAVPPYGFDAGAHRFSASAGLNGVHVSCPADATEQNRGLVLQACIRETDIQRPDAAVHQQLTAEHPDWQVPDTGAWTTEWLRWMSAFLNTPYEVGGKWFGGLSPGGRSTNVAASTGYDGYGIDCTGLPSTARAILDGGWGDSFPEWRRTTYAQNNPIPALPLYDHWNDWQWSPRRWVRRAGRFERFTQEIARFVQPGDFLDTGNPDGPINHVRTVYRVVERDRSGDTWIEIIEASSSEAGKVRTTRQTTRSGDPLLLLEALTNSATQYGLWRPLTTHPSSDPFG